MKRTLVKIKTTLVQTYLFDGVDALTDLDPFSSATEIWQAVENATLMEQHEDTELINCKIFEED